MEKELLDDANIYAEALNLGGADLWLLECLCDLDLAEPINIKRLIKKTGKSRSWVERVLIRLRSLGYIQTEKKGRNHFRVDLSGLRNAIAAIPPERKKALKDAWPQENE